MVTKDTLIPRPETEELVLSTSFLEQANLLGSELWKF